MGPLPAELTVADLAGALRREAHVKLERTRAARDPDAPSRVPAVTEIRLGEEMTQALERFVDGIVTEGLLPEDFADGASLPEGLAQALAAASAAAPRPRHAGRPRSTGAAHARALAAKGRAGVFHRAHLSGDTDMAAPTLDALLPVIGVTVPDAERAVLARAALRVLADVHQDEARRELGDVPRPESDPVLTAIRIQAPESIVSSVPTSVEQAQPISADRPNSPPAPPADGERPKDSSSASPHRATKTKVDPALAPDAMFSAVIDYAVSAARKEGADGKTLRDIEVAGRLFLEFAGDRSMATLSWADVAVFRDEALRMPRLHGRSIFAGLTPFKAIDLADAIDEGNRAAAIELLGEKKAEDALRRPSVERMSKKTINKHLSSLAGAARRWYEVNRREDRQRSWTPFAGEFFPKSETAEDVRVIRTSLTDGELAALYNSPRFTGHGTDRLRALPGSHIERDGRYWSPLIGLYSALRLEEALQLRPKDIDVVQGVTVFCIGRDPEFRVKTPAARRLVPIHPILIQLGLLEHAAEMRRRGERQLFPELERGGPDERFSYAFSKEFTEYRRAIGVYAPGRDFHALRHSAATALFNDGADTSVVAAILGHTQKGVSAGVYLSGYKLPKLREAIARLQFGIEPVLLGSKHVPRFL